MGGRKDWAYSDDRMFGRPAYWHEYSHKENLGVRAQVIVTVLIVVVVVISSVLWIM